LIANWPGTISSGRTTSDLVDASDFLPTLAELAHTKIPDNWHHDGISFVPSLLDRDGPRRESCFFWYDPRPGWEKERFSRHIFALNKEFKLFSDDRLFDISGEGFREELIIPSQESPAAKAARKELKQAIQEMMQPPISAAAKEVVDAYGDPVTDER